MVNGSAKEWFVVDLSLGMDELMMMRLDCPWRGISFESFGRQGNESSLDTGHWTEASLERCVRSTTGQHGGYHNQHQPEPNILQFLATKRPLNDPSTHSLLFYYAASLCS